MSEFTWIRSDRLNGSPAREEEDIAMNIERDIGRLEAVARNIEHQIIELKQERDEMRRDLAELEKKFDAKMNEITDLMSQIKGGSRVVLWAGGLISGGLGAAFIKFVLPLFLR